MSSPKVVVIGAGSLFFGRQAIFAMIQSPALSQGTLSLVDHNAERLDKMMALARRAIAHAKSPLKLEGSTNYRDVLPQADFVVLSFANQGVKYRGIDCAIALRHGIRLCSGDTIGPGGVFRAMRELPHILAMCRDIEKICPDAWVINYINPSSVHGIALMRHAPKLKSFALCDGLHMPHIQHRYMEHANIPVNAQNEADFKMQIAGVNHFTWMLKASFQGKDVLPAIRESIQNKARTEKDEGQSKRKFNQSCSLQLWDIFGALPTCTAHTKEYVRFWQGHGINSDSIQPLSIFDIEERYRRHNVMWQEVEQYNSGQLPMSHFFENIQADHATDIIEAMWTNAKKTFYINSPNRGAVGNLPSDAFLELLCDLDMNGPKPQPVGDFPLGLRSLQMQILDTHELTVEAIVRHDKKLLARALCTDPLTNSIPDAYKMIEEVLAEEKEALPAEWYH